MGLTSGPGAGQGTQDAARHLCLSAGSDTDDNLLPASQSQTNALRIQHTGGYGDGGRARVGRSSSSPSPPAHMLCQMSISHKFHGACQALGCVLHIHYLTLTLASIQRRS